jgi:hypothetical protein
MEQGSSISRCDLISRLKNQIGEPSQSSFVSSAYFTNLTPEKDNGEKSLNNPEKV